MNIADVLNNLHFAVGELTAEGGAFQVSNEEVYGELLPVYKVAPDNLRGIYEACLGYDQKEFLVYHQQRLSFAEVYQRAASLSAALSRDYAVKKGDRVAIAMRNNPEWIIAFMAITSLGAIAVPMNAWWTTEELRYGFEDSGAKVVIADRQRLERLQPFASELSLTAITVSSQKITDDQIDFNEVVSRYPNEPAPTVSILPDDDATILYTSGSSGTPKGVVASHRSILSSLVSWLLLGVASEQIGATPDNMPPAENAVALLTIPLFHVTGCHSLFLLSMIIGRKVIMMHKWDPEQALALIEQEKVTYVNGVPTMSQELLDAAEHSDRDISSLVELGSGGAARPAEHVRRISETFKMNPVNGYGLTETNAMGAVNAGMTYIQQPDSVGIPSPAITQIRIVDEQGKELAMGERGEICIKSAANARCYWNNPEATAEAFKAGWFYTGDVGYLDDQGMLFIVDRIKDIIIRGGENISCSEVESSIYSYAGVAEVAVFGVPDDRLGEAVAAVIYLKPGIELTAEALQDFLKQHIAAFKLPEYIQFSEQPLPRTATDKIFKRAIKEQFRC